MPTTVPGATRSGSGPPPAALGQLVRRPDLTTEDDGTTVLRGERRRPGRPARPAAQGPRHRTAPRLGRPVSDESPAHRPTDPTPPHLERHDHEQIHPRHRHGQRGATPGARSRPGSSCGGRLRPRRRRRWHLLRRLLGQGQPERPSDRADRRELPRGGQGDGAWSSSPPRTTSPSRRTAPTSPTVLADVAKVAHVESVGDPFADGTISEDGRIGYAQLTLDAPVRDLDKPEFTVISEAVSGVEVEGIQVELGGDAVFLKAEDDTGHIGIGLLVALLVLLVVFGTLVSAVLPIGLALVAVGAGIGGIMLMAALDGRLGLGHPCRRSGRPRRRRRLRPVHRRPLPREPRRRARTTSAALAAAMGTSGLGGGLRRRHGRHRHRGPRHHRARRPHLDRPRHRADGVLRRRRRHHPAARGAQPPGRPDRQGQGGPPPPSGQAAPRTPPGGASGTGSPDAPGPTCSARSPPCSRSPPRRCGCRPPSPPPGTHRPTPRTGRPTTCSPRASAPASTGRCWWSSTSTTQGVSADGIDAPHRGHRGGPADRLGQRAAGLGRRRHGGLHGGAHHRTGRPRHLARHRAGARRSSPATSTSPASRPSPTTSTPSSGRRCRCSSASSSRSRSCC